MSDLLQTLRTVQEWLNGTGPADELSAFEVRQIVDKAVIGASERLSHDARWLRALASTLRENKRYRPTPETHETLEALADRLDSIVGGDETGCQINVPSKGWLRAILNDFTHACCKKNAGVKEVTRVSGRSLVDMLHDALEYRLEGQAADGFTEDDLFQAFIEGFESRAGRYHSYVWEEWDKRKYDLLDRLSSGGEESTPDEEPDAYRYRYPTERGWRYVTDRKDLPPPLLVDGKWNDVELEELYVGDEEGG